MSLETLFPSLVLLRKVLSLEIKQGYQNRSTSGMGIQTYFRQQFEKYECDEAMWAAVESILAYLRRYEKADTIEERERVAQIVLKRLDATLRRYEPTATGSASESIAPDSRQGPARRAQPPSVAVSPHVARTEVPGAGAPKPEAATGVIAPAESAMPADRAKAASELPAASGQQVRPAARASGPPSRDAKEAVESLDAAAAEALHVRTQEQPRLQQLGISDLKSAIEYWPRDHYDYSAPVRINQMRPDMQVTLVGTLRSVDTRRTPNRNVQVVEAKVADPTGMMAVTWFNQVFMLKQLQRRVGEEVAISGKVEMYNGRLQLAPRDVEFPSDDEDGTNTRRIVPVYPSSEGIAQRWIRRLVSRALAVGADLIEDPLPEPLRRQFELADRRGAVRQFHFPDSMQSRDLARNRLALDELLLIQIGMLQRKRHWQGDEDGVSIPSDDSLMAQFRAGLPFTLTGAQERSLAEILADMSRPVPMSRLLQGDVGSGKTVVAAAALLMCARAGYQGAIMAPTEILVEQHARTLTALLEPFGVRVAMLTGSVPKAQRARIYLDALQGTIHVLVGTHALIQEGFRFGRLGLAIVDEQHRFGVVQRAALKGKGYNPHLLVMTATPIPRTLTLTLYGDLDVSVIDERPPARQPVETRWTPVEQQAYTLVREQVQASHQAYIICPLVEESENLEAKAAVAEGKRLQEKVFPDMRLDVLHGKMKAQDKDAVLSRFRDGEIDVLVATSVVEVGIDVPNATAMVVQDAQRFGLAQLHQFRGRVGRGGDKSYCVLLADPNSPGARERLQALTMTDDGFKLAEEDLRLRGPGEFWGTRQSGLPALQVAQVTDMPTLALARRVAETILQEDPALAEPRYALLAGSVRTFWDRAAEPS